ncbi:MAG TPA: 16S rRNA (guanine(966)-N(2))-methyltransferase RsmD [Mycobacteriales bacterium]|jgi:16S rRNA (guanine966-N2)-methyltransferase|nr:16S rRNA (guanine(966)-N(2))-methyltransferase RsmD [Mycobacteriales bacterium]
MSRIIAGVAGGRRLSMPAGDATRPTADRAREGLFSTLTSLRGNLDGASFLDLYAGSGAVGLEAASRGASRVLLVERDPEALRAARANIDALGLAGVELRADPVERVLAADPGAPFDVVFADPPYAEPVDPTIDRLAAGGWLASDAVVVVERASRDREPAWPATIEALRSRRYGEATLWYGRRP